jgi:hypothetical protein|tara:strand:- start:410 stop:796 length:387 start_codon:yes stop_codon:yes gene_type:complete
MGMYTELFFTARLKKDTPEEVVAILKHLFEEGSYDLGLSDKPNHEFFECHRWDCIGNMSSFYFTPFPLSAMRKLQGSYFITSRSDLKNYDGEINKFIDWVTPYLEGYEGDCIGWTHYEESEQPTLLFI